MHGPERASGALREEIRRNTVAHELDEPRALLRATQEVAQDRLAVLFGGLPDRPRDLDLVHPDRGNVDGNRRVDVVVRKDSVEGPPIVVEARLRRQVDRIPERRLWRRPRSHEVQGRGAKLRESEALGHEFVDGHDRGASGVGDDRDPIPARQRLQGERLRVVEELLDGVRAEHPGLVEDGLRREVGSTEGARVRDRRAAPRV